MNKRPAFTHFNKFSELDTEKIAIEPLDKSTIANMTLLEKLEYLIEITSCCELKDENLDMHKDLIQSVADDLNLTPSQTIMLSPYISNPSSSFDNEDLTRYFNCSAIKIMKNHDDIKELIKRRYISVNSSFRQSGEMQLTNKAEKALCKNQGLPPVKTSGLNPIEFLNFIKRLINEYSNAAEYIDKEELIAETIKLIKENKHLKIAEELNKLKVSNEEKFVLLYFCEQFLTERIVAMPLFELSNYVEDFFDFADALTDGTHPFIKEDLLKVADKDRIMSKDVYSLTNKARKLFLSEYKIHKETSSEIEFDNAKLIKSTNITTKSMFYSAEDQEQISTLQNLLDDKQLKAIRKRLKAANMREGFNCLFYGLPGTGKTETVLQLAKMTKRDIMQVDISSMRDKWFGETEKIVKKVFYDYADFAKSSKRIPILLINEADALLSIRTSIGDNNPSIEKTENAIQNILLESMENFDGILIATTNLTCNLDKAFERRFIYKVEFHQPSVEAKSKIWKSFLPALSDSDATRLATDFDFSGGQIENISRKIIVDQLLYGTALDIKHIEKICSKERLSSNSTGRRAIGFREG